jgi:hypothetical protein
MKYFESDFATIEWNSATKTVQIAYKESSALHNAPSQVYGETISANLRTTMNIALDLAEKHGSSSVIGDMRNLGLLTSEDEEWSTVDLFPRLHAAGVRHIAIVPPETLIGKLFFDVLMRRAQGITIQRVSSVEEARFWLKEQLN